MSQLLSSIATKIIATYNGKETEHNWERVDTLLKELSIEVSKCPSNEEILVSIKRIFQVLQETVHHAPSYRTCPPNLIGDY